jgi:hypothetical protein
VPDEASATTREAHVLPGKFYCTPASGTTAAPAVVIRALADEIPTQGRAQCSQRAGSIVLRTRRVGSDNVPDEASATTREAHVLPGKFYCTPASGTTAAPAVVIRALADEIPSQGRARCPQRAGSIVLRSRREQLPITGTKALEVAQIVGVKPLTSRRLGTFHMQRIIDRSAGHSPSRNAINRTLVETCRQGLNTDFFPQAFGDHGPRFTRLDTTGQRQRGKRGVGLGQSMR